MNVAKMPDERVLQETWHLTDLLSDRQPSAEVDKLVHGHKARFNAVMADSRLGELRAKIVGEAADLDARIADVRSSIGEAAVAAELDGFDTKAAAGLQRELAKAIEARDSIAARLAAVDVRIRADAASVTANKREMAREIAAELATEKKRRRQEALPELRRILAFLASFRGDDDRLTTNALSWDTRGAQLDYERMHGGAA